MLFRIAEWTLRVLGDGTRRVDFWMQAPSHEVIEQVGASSGQRCFVADPEGEKFKKLRDRLISRGDPEPHAQVLLATLHEDLTQSRSQEHEDRGCGEAEFQHVQVRITSTAMDELLRQDGQGRAVSYIEMEFEGLERCTKEDSEDGLVNSRWKLQGKPGFSRVLGIAFSFIRSPVYEEKVPTPPLPTKDDFDSLKDLVQRHFGETRKTRQYVGALCIIGLLLLILVWVRH